MKTNNFTKRLVTREGIKIGRAVYTHPLLWMLAGRKLNIFREEDGGWTVYDPWDRPLGRLEKKAKK